jgi:hypothetical protein
MSFQEFISLYTTSTPPFFVFLQIALAGLATAALITGIFGRLFVNTCESQFEKLQSLSGVISSIAPLLGFLLTLLGASVAPRMMSNGDLSGASEAISLALMSSLVGCATSVIAICAMYISSTRCQAEESF